MRVNRVLAHLALVSLFSGLLSCGKAPIAVVPGVSLELAKHRAATISNINYELSFLIPEGEDQEIEGFVNVSFVLSDGASPLQLDFRESPDKIRRVVANGEQTDFLFHDEHIVIPGSDLMTGPNSVEIEFTAGSSSLNRNPEFLYTLFVPDRARTAFPLFDQPDLKASYELTLIIPNGWTAMSNAPISDIADVPSGVRYRFLKSDRISSYLFSFVAGKFETVAREIDGRTITMLHRETDAEKVARNIDDIFALHAASIDWLEEYSGIDYPYQQFGFALIPAFQYGGMEHVGAIQYSASSLFLDEAPSETRLLGRAGLIAHETAHMWFGNLVTMEWFNDVWTKEVFANFMAAKIVNPSFPDVNHDLNFLVRHYPSAYSVDRTSGANAIRQFLPNLNEAGQMYGAIIYNKAPIMMRHLEEMMGEELFREGMQEYLETFAFGNATWPALVEILDRKSDEDLQAWSQIWVETAGRSGIEAQWKTGVDGESDPFRYGLVPADISSLEAWEAQGEVARAAELINLYEQLLGGEGPRPEQHVELLTGIVEVEENQLILNLALGQLKRVFWSLLSEAARSDHAPVVERVLWDAMLAQTEASKRKVYFEAFVDVALTPDEIRRARDVWSGELRIDNLPLAENDLISIAQILAIKLPEEAETIVATQIGNTENPDNVRKLEFIAPSLSADPEIRNRFFASLADEKNRQTESWVLDALANLHHPLRIDQSEQYIRPSLELLQEIQVTGDIFFPKRWLDETLGNQRSGAAVLTVRTFLDERPDYNEQLRMKILQSADMMFRANAILGAGQ
jgi:aminopeptidase N